MQLQVKAAIMKAGAENKVLDIKYVDSKGVVSKRLVEPYEWKNDKLYAYCLNKQGIRAFSLNNINTAVVTDTKYEPRWPLKLQGVLETEKTKTKVKKPAWLTNLLNIHNSRKIKK